ncbi:MAG: exodeoxyribonuclease V subunit gamma, partial [Clostridioides sp.]|nr:exodeoxyribonuclease V subunit gamma [Clostridioides sp.]
MSVRFIFGRGGIGKTSYILEDIKRRTQNDERSPILIIVPEQYSFSMEKKISKLFTGDVKDKNLRTRVITFNSLGKIVFSEVGGLTKVNIDSSGKNIITYKSFLNISNELEFFSKKTSKAGFVNKISEIIYEFKKYNVNVEKLKESRKDIDDDMLNAKLNDIVKIYEEFEKNLHENYVDSQDTLELLAEKIHESKSLSSAHIYIDEFTGFTPKEFSVLMELMKVASEVDITLTLDNCDSIEYNPTDVFSRTKSTYKRFVELCNENGIKILENINLNDISSINSKNSDSIYKEINNKYIKNLNGYEIKRFKDNKELIHLEKNYNFFPQKVYTEKTENIRIKEFNDLHQEVEETAKEILYLIKNKNVRFKDITVSMRDLNRYNFLIKQVFDDYNIPYFLDEKRNSINNPVVVLLISLLEMKQRNYSYDVMFTYLKSGLISIDEEDINLIENYVLANGIKGKKWFRDNWDYKLSYKNALNDVDMEKEENILKLQRINEIKNSITRPIINFEKKIYNRKIIKKPTQISLFEENDEDSKNKSSKSKKSTVEDICRYLYEFMIETKLDEKIESLIEKFYEIGETELAKEYSQIWDIVIDMLDQMVELMGNEIITRDEFTKLLKVGFEEHKLAIIPPCIDQVLVSSVDRMKNDETKYLYLLGVNDGVFPL